MHKDIKEIFFTQKQLNKRVKELGEQISQKYQGKELLVIGILKGAVIFFADLIRQIDIPLEIDFMVVSSYGAGSVSSQTITIKKDIDYDISQYHVLIVEDILDTGNTLAYLKEDLTNRNPKSVSICTLLDKPSRRTVDIKADYVGFEVPNEFIVGYGLDYNGAYRNIPYIGILDPNVYSKAEALLL